MPPYDNESPHPSVNQGARSPRDGACALPPGGHRLAAMVSASESPRSNLPAAVCVPGHVVYRDFVAETVVLNLNTGTYHGLNPTAGRMLKLLDELGDIDAVATQLANEYRRTRAEIAEDLESLCHDLLARDLIDAAPPRG